MAKTTQQPKAPKRISRSTAANTVVAGLDGRTTLTELAKQADQLFVEHGGKSQVKASLHHVRRALETAESLGVVRLTRPTDLFVERVKK